MYEIILIWKFWYTQFLRSDAAWQHKKWNLAYEVIIFTNIYGLQRSEEDLYVKENHSMMYVDRYADSYKIFSILLYFMCLNFNWNIFHVSWSPHVWCEWLLYWLSMSLFLVPMDLSSLSVISSKHNLQIKRKWLQHSFISPRYGIERTCTTHT